MVRQASFHRRMRKKTDINKRSRDRQLVEGLQNEGELLIEDFLIQGFRSLLH